MNSRHATSISGFGVFTTFGPNDRAIVENVFAGKHGFREISRFDTRPFRAHHAAQALQAPSLQQALLDCAGTALRMARIEPDAPAALLLGTQGDWTGLSRFWARTEIDDDDPHDDSLMRTAPIAVVHELASALALGPGRRLAFTNGCIASTNAIIYGAQLLETGRADVVLAGGAYLVDLEFFAKFDSGRAFASDGQVRTFSRDRTGLLLGDGVAILVLERAADARARNVRPLARLLGWGMSSDGYHVCQPDPRGAGLAAAMTSALVRAGVAPAEIDYVNAHGTGTRINDAAESSAIQRVFGAANRRVPVSSTKTATGHMLEGAGAVEAVISALTLREQCLPPTIGYTGPDPDCDVDCVPNKARCAPVRYVMSVNAAFGGANAALVLGMAS